MKIAFVHDRIVHEWWAEMVLRDLVSTSVFDDAKIFVLFSIHKKLIVNSEQWIEKKITTSFATPRNDKIELDIITALPIRLNNIFIYFNTRKIPILSALFDYRNLMFWFPVLCRMLRKKIERYNADEILISSFAAAKNIIKDTSSLFPSPYSLSPKVTLYLHSPMQYIRENYEENVKKFSFPIKQLYQFATTYLRPRDKKSRHYDVVLCNSNYTAKLAKQLYGLEWQVSYPIVDKLFFNEPVEVISKEYFVFVWRIQKYVREIWTIIDACNQTHSSLVVIWDWPDMDYAKSIAWPTIIFVWRIDDVSEKVAIMKHAKWLINIAKESFGLGTAEALCLWVPVLGYNWWATPELVDESNWVLIDDKSTNIVEWIEEFCGKEFDRKKIAEDARWIFGK